METWRALLALLLLFCSVNARKKDANAHAHKGNARTLSLHGAHVRMHRRSGTLRAWREEDEGVSKPVHLSFWSVTKLDSDSGRVVEKMSENMTRISFDLGQVQQGNLSFATNVTARKFAFQTDLRFLTIKGVVAMAEEAGEVTLGGGRTLAVRPGMFQVLVKLCHLPWHHLHDSVGDYLDLKFKVRESPADLVEEFGAGTGERGASRRFLLGPVHTSSSSPYVDVAGMVRRSTQWLPLVEGYPRPERGPNGEHLLAVRSQLPNGCVIFVMVIEPGHVPPPQPRQHAPQEDATSNTSGASSLSAVTWLSLLIVATRWACAHVSGHSGLL